MRGRSDERPLVAFSTLKRGAARPVFVDRVAKSETRSSAVGHRQRLAFVRETKHEK